MGELLAKFILWRHRPKIVIVTGSIGKTCTREAIFSVLKRKFRVKRNRDGKNERRDIIFNILGIEEIRKNPFKGVAGFLKAIFSLGDYPEIFVFETGLRKSGDLKKFKFLKPEVVIITALGEIPAYIEFFDGPKSLASQNFKALEKLPHFGYAVLNYDDETVRKMGDIINAHTLTFGFQNGADFAVSDIAQNFSEDNLKNSGTTFKLNHDGHSVPVWLYQVYGKPQVYAALAGVVLGSIFKMNLIEISDALKNYKSPLGRMTLEEGMNGSWIINDYYEASPNSMISAVQTLKEFCCKQRKIAILGDMIGIGKYTEQAHRIVGEACSKFLDLLLCVGPRAKFIADEAVNRGFPSERVFEFESAEQAGRMAQKTVRGGDLILVKGSREMQMEKATAQIKKYPAAKNN